MTATETNEDVLRAAVADLPTLPWLAADFVAADGRFGHDHAGDPALWVRLVAKDEATARPGFYDGLFHIRERIREHLRSCGLGDEFVYFTLWSEDDVRNPPGDDE